MAREFWRQECWNCAHSCECKAVSGDLMLDGFVVPAGESGFLCLVERDEEGTEGEVKVVGDYDWCEKWESV